MTAPQLTVYRQGQGVVSGDGANTFCQTTDVATDLRAFIGTLGLQVFVRGAAVINDGGAGNFYWNALGTGPDDGINNIVPPGAALGCWTRIITESRLIGIEKELSGNTVPSTGVFDDGFLPFAVNITGWVLQADVVGSAVIDVWAAPYVDGVPPTVTNSITGSTPPTIASAQSAHDYNLVGWNTIIAAKSAFRYNLVSVATVKRLVLTLVAERVVA